MHSFCTFYFSFPNYRNFQKYVPIDSANLSNVIASAAKQSDPLLRIILSLSKGPSTWLGTMLCIGLLRRRAPRNDSLAEQIFDNRYRPSLQYCICPARQKNFVTGKIPLCYPRK